MKAKELRASLQLFERLVHLLGEGVNPADIRVVIVNQGVQEFLDALSGPSGQQAEIDAMAAGLRAETDSLAAETAAHQPPTT